MTRRLRTALCGATLTFLLVPVAAPGAPIAPSLASAPPVAFAHPIGAAPSVASAQAALDRLAVPFVANAGQWDARAAFAAQTFAGTLFVTTDGRLVWRLVGKPVAAGTSAEIRDRAHVPHRIEAAHAPGPVLTETLVDANRQPRPATPTAAGPASGTVSYALGADERRHRDALPGRERVDLGQVYPGIDVQLRATGRNVEKIFTVAPNRDPGAIRVRLDGALRIEPGAAGTLVAQTSAGPVTYTAPIAWQDDLAGAREPVPVQYALDTATHTWGFAVGRYDASRPLVIDPLLQSTYVGGNNDDRIRGIAIHPGSGEVYVAGYTYSTNFPKVAGSEQTSHAADGGSFDAFVTRLNPALTARLQSTYIGGNGDDFCVGIAIHPSTGDVYVGGTTLSTDFPKAAGGAQGTLHGSTAAWVTRLNAALTTRMQSTYLGGSSGDSGLALAVHPFSGEVYVAGEATSTDFPGTTGAEQVAKAAGSDAFVARLNAALTGLQQSTYLGGNGEDKANALVIHPATGEIYVTGQTTSSNFPKVTGAEQTASGGGATDAFVTRLNAPLTQRLQSTYLGGNGDDSGVALAVHPVTGEVYVTGFTASTDFPKNGGGAQASLPGVISGFVTRLGAALTSRVQSTYLGSTGVDVPAAIAISPSSGEVYVAGQTDATAFPMVAGGAQSTKGLNVDGFVTRHNKELTIHAQSTWLGGNGEDLPQALLVHPATGEVIIAGYTSSTNFPGVAGAEQATQGGVIDGFITRLSPDLRGTGAVPAGLIFASKLTAAPSSLQVSAPATIGGLLDNPQVISLLGGNLARYCVSSTASCTCDVVPWGAAPSTIANGQSVCVQQYAPPITPASATATVLVGGGSASYFVSTAVTCGLDTDGNGSVDALTDGLMILRAMFGLTGTAVTQGAVGAGAARTTWDQIRAFLNSNCGAAFAQ